MTTSSSATSSSPRVSFAPPVPPARQTTPPPRSSVAATPLLLLERREQVAVGQAGDPDARVRLVAPVDADQERGQRLDEAGHLQRPGVDASQALDPLDQPRDPALVVALGAADQHVLVEARVEVL